jgi:hypothetical protein
MQIKRFLTSAIHETDSNQVFNDILILLQLLPAFKTELYSFILPAMSAEAISLETLYLLLFTVRFW